MKTDYIANTSYLYQATDSGEIVSLVYSNPRVLKAQRNTKGYAQVCLSYDGERKTKEVHRLIYETFSGSIPPGYVIDHIDNDRMNNKLSNLQAVTQKQNVRKARDLGRMEGSFRAAHANGKKRAKGYVKQSGIKHVYWNRKPGKWFGMKWVDGKRYSTGTFDYPNDALEALAALLP